MEQKLKQCDETNKQLQENCIDGQMIVQFKKSSFLITEIEEQKIIDYAIRISEDRSGSIYAVEGYASNSGNSEYNQILSKDRAKMVYYTLIDYGVDESRLYYTGNGVADNNEYNYLDQKVIIRKVE